MDWLKDPAWRLGVAIVLAVAGTVLTYHGAAGTDDELGAMAIVGFALFCLGMAVPLVSQVLGARRESTGKSEDVS